MSDKGQKIHFLAIEPGTKPKRGEPLRIESRLLPAGLALLQAEADKYDSSSRPASQQYDPADRPKKVCRRIVSISAIVPDETGKQTLAKAVYYDELVVPVEFLQELPPLDRSWRDWATYDRFAANMPPGHVPPELDVGVDYWIEGYRGVGRGGVNCISDHVQLQVQPEK